MILNFFTSITLFGFFLNFLLSVFFWVTKKGVRIENKLLSTILLVFNLQIFYSFTTSNYTFQFFMEWHKFIFILKQTSLLFGPLIYFYVNSFLKKSNIFQARNLLHFLPFVIVTIILLFYYVGKNDFIIWQSNITLSNTILILLHNFIYLVDCVLIMKKKDITFKGFFKIVQTSPHKTWLQLLLLGFIVIWIVNLNSWAIIMIVQKPSWCAYTASIYALIVFVFVNLLMFMVLLNPDIYYVITKYKNTKVKEEDKSEYVKKIVAHFELNKPFLNPEITLETLANELSLSPRMLSQIINETFNKTFKSFILEFRIKESMQLLSDQKYGNLTILEILYKVGFNTKSAFNNQFKLHTNLTPQEYRSKFMTEKVSETYFS